MDFTSCPDRTWWLWLLSKSLFRNHNNKKWTVPILSQVFKAITEILKFNKGN